MGPRMQKNKKRLRAFTKTIANTPKQKKHKRAVNKNIEKQKNNDIQQKIKKSNKKKPMTFSKNVETQQKCRKTKNQ